MRTVGKLLKGFDLGAKPLLIGTLAPDGKSMAVSYNGAQRGVRLFDTTTGVERGKLVGLEMSANAVDFVAEGRLIVTGSYRQAVVVWDASRLSPVGRLPYVAPTVGANGTPASRSYLMRSAVSRDGRFLIVESAEGSIELHELPSPLLEGIAAAPTTVAQASVLKHVRRLREPNEAMIQTLALSADGALAAIGYGDSQSVTKKIVLLETADGRERAVLTASDLKVVRLNFSNNGQTLVGVTSPVAPTGAAAMIGTTIHQWSTTNLALQRMIALPSEFSGAPGYSPDGSRIAVGTRSGSVQLWDAVSGKPSGQLKASEGSVVALSFSADGNTLLTSANVNNSKDEPLKLWDLRSEE